MIVRVVHKHKIDVVDLQAHEAFVERSSNTVRAVIELGPQSRTVAERTVGVDAGNQYSTDLGRDRDLLTSDPRFLQGCAKTCFGEAVAVERGGIEVADSLVQRGMNCCTCIFFGDLGEQTA